MFARRFQPGARGKSISPTIRVSGPASTARRMRSPIVELLADVAAALDGASIPWYLFGAQAAILHGAARLTADVDVTVRLSDDFPNEALAQALERHRFRRQIVDLGFIRNTRVIPFVHEPTDLPLDVVLAGPGIEDRFFERVQVRDVDGVSVRLASPEDLVVMKILAGRPKDIDDVVAIAAAQGNRFDVAYVERLLTLLEEGLAQNDLIPTFRTALTRAK